MPRPAHQTEGQQVADASARPYRFGFILNTTIGNLTRYTTLRKYAERECGIEFDWQGITHNIDPEFARRRRWLPRGVVLRLWLFHQMGAGLHRMRSADAVMLHLFEAELALVFWRLFSTRPLLVSSTDEAPIVDRRSYPLYPKERAKPVWRQRLRLALDRWRASRIDRFVPFSRWTAGIFVNGCDVAPEKVYPIHVGLDLEVWTPRRRDDAASGPFRILFVGNDFIRKGGDILLRVFEERFSSRAELDLVTPHAPAAVPARVRVHADVAPQDPRLLDLYAQCDVLVLPTTADLVPWTFLEAMAMQRPVIGTDVGAIPELVDHGVTGFIVPPGDVSALSEAIERLIADPELRARFGRAGRSKVERHYDAARNVPKILAVMKKAVDASRG